MRWSFRIITRLFDVQRALRWNGFFPKFGLWRTIIFRMRHNISIIHHFNATMATSGVWWFGVPPEAPPRSTVLKFIFWFCGKGFVNTTEPYAMNIKEYSIWGHKWVRWSSPYNLQGNLTLCLGFLSPPKLLFFFFSLLSFSFLFPPFQLFLPFFLFCPGYWSPFLVQWF